MVLVPIDFVKESSDILVKYKDKFHAGTIVEASEVLTDENGNQYLNCRVKYKGSDRKIYEEVLYNDDFNNLESPDAWKLASNECTTLINEIINNQNDYSALLAKQDQLQQMLQKKKRLPFCILIAYWFHIIYYTFVFGYIVNQLYFKTWMVGIHTYMTDDSGRNIFWKYMTKMIPT
jgi:hypothetical protein